MIYNIIANNMPMSTDYKFDIIIISYVAVSIIILPSNVSLETWEKTMIKMVNPVFR